MTSQQENIKNLLTLAQENPELRILPMVDTYCVPSDDFRSWVAEWGKSEIDEIWCYEGAERIYCKSDDYDYLVEEKIGEIECDDNSDDLELLARIKVDAYNWEKVIIVRITTP